MSERKLLGRILQEMRVINAAQLKQALVQQQQEPGKRIGDIVLEMGIANVAQITQALARQFDMPFVTLEKVEIQPDVVDAVPRAVAEENRIMPVKRNGKSITIAMTDPLDLFTLDNLRFILNTEIDCVLATEEDVQKAIARFYGSAEESAFEDVYEEATMTQSELELRGVDDDDAGDASSDDAPVIKFVQLMISEAVKSRASDIHVEPMEKHLRVRYRVDGVCREMNSPPKRLQGAILSRIKIMATMDIAEKRKPQDGRIAIKAGGKALDLRVSALPSTWGESMVMRILDKESSMVGLEELGFSGSDFKRFQSIIKRPNGIFLVTGPTGSGKTTTLYSALHALNRPDVKIITAENPVEYNISGINQAQVRHDIGLSFARILRAMLRQAPNIILVGEIRDEETAEIAIQAALTGHLVFSTLHTNDAPSALTRLIDMGVKPFLVASSVQAVMAQRLVRILCPECKVEYTPENHELKAIGVTPEQVGDRTFRKPHPDGCDKCSGRGYKGRKGIFELLEMDANMRELVFEKSSSVQLRQAARQNGMVTLLEDGIRKILTGQTSVAEVLSLTHRQDIDYNN
jgi:type IV pilus assembly protein PilB